MYIKYGNYQHADNEASAVIELEPMYNERGRRHRTKQKWTINGELQAASQAALTTAINALEAAYAVNGGNLGLYLDDGTATSHVLLDANTLGGTRVTGLSYPEGKGAEYATFRTYQITVEAEIPIATETLLAWMESLTFIGGGPKFVHLQTINGLPQKQLVNQSTPYTVQQEGRAIGASSWPAAAPPIWPAAEKRDLRRIVRRGPKRAANSLSDYEITWSYQFESAVPLNGNPSAL